ncbi:MAG: ferritin-like domain-containing protein [bacterium]
MDKQYRDILEFAIEREVDAYNFYTEAGKHAKTSAAREFFDQLARQELGHKQTLEAMHLTREVLMDLSGLKLDDYSLKESYSNDMQFHMEYQQILLLAMKRENLSVKLYTDMRKLVKDKEQQKIFDRLIKEEQSHHDLLQKEYDAYVMTED